MKGWKTIIFMVLVAIIGALQSVGLADWIGLVGEKTAGLIVSGIGVTGVILRFLTTTAVGEKT